ncbi:ectoine hydroxylase [Nocardiopsis algeriensis]|uniref:Ectoine hydroxylase n=1 Tax=Nocardiopsis algeriensis TaxID=1478215 RepID=A0A841IVM1_9ACTN|nr:ectoine hydroxylase [Nocardiopsis algeriensis]MBB6120251.1 ectoine hydroxylase [Nocardiopsis algeriensis]
MTLQMDLPTLDDYPTRKATEAALLYRKDPTVWGTAEDGPFTDQELRDYDARGYAQIEGLVTDDEVRTYYAELERLGNDPELRGDERLIVEPTSEEVRSVFEVHKISKVFSELVNDPRLVERARQILGSDVYVHQSRVNYKPGFGGGSFTWHSDFETWHAEDGMPRMRAVSFSIALTENFSHNGPLMIMPGSHKTFVSCIGETPEDYYKSSLKSQDIGVPDQGALTCLADRHGIDVLTGPAGGITMFDSNCMHGSGGNITPYPRSNVFIVYNSVENACGTPFAASAPRPEFLSARDFTPVGR